MKLPTPRKLPSGSYHIQLRLNGRSVSITAAAEKECTRKAALIKAQHIAGLALDFSQNAYGNAYAGWLSSTNVLIVAPSCGT